MTRKQSRYLPEKHLEEALRAHAPPDKLPILLKALWECPTGGEATYIEALLLIPLEEFCALIPRSRTALILRALGLPRPEAQKLTGAGKDIFYRFPRYPHLSQKANSLEEALRILLPPRVQQALRKNGHTLQEGLVPLVRGEVPEELSPLLPMPLEVFLSLPEKIRWTRLLHHIGLTIPHIAKLEGVGDTVVASRIRRVRKSTRWKQVQKLLQKGLSQAEIARRLGISRQRVHALIRYIGAGVKSKG